MAGERPGVRTWSDLTAGVTPQTLASEERIIADAPPFPPDARGLLRQVFAGTGEVIVAAQRENKAA
jgi:hypothetical protein